MNDTTLRIQLTATSALWAECEQLREFAPGPEHMLFPQRWQAAPVTYDWLVEMVLDAQHLEPGEREYVDKRIRESKATLIYRDAPIDRTEEVPEDRLWPF